MLASLALSLVSRGYSRPELLAWEQDEALAQLRRVVQAIEREIDHLRAFNSDWSNWDDAYEFVAGHNPHFVDATLQENNFASAKVNLIAFYRSDGHLIWAGYHPRSTDPDPDPAPLMTEQLKALALSAAQRGAAGDAEQSVAGLVLTAGRLMLVSAHLVLPSNGAGPAQGVMLAGRTMDADFLNRLRTQTEMDLAIAPFDQLADLVGPAGLPDTFDPGGLPLLRRVSNRELQVLTPYPDARGERALVIRVNLPRALFLQGERLLSYSLYGTAAVFLGALALAGALLQWLVFSPIERLAQRTAQVRASGDYSARLGTGRKDEIGQLSQEFDRLLARIDAQAQDLTALSFDDALTGVKNRRYLDEQLATDWSLLQRTQQPLALLLFDIDDFKRYNDVYGHRQGDRALIAVAKAAEGIFRRASDFVARYGGEEVVIVLPGLGIEEATEQAERLREAVLDLGLRHSASSVADIVTVSVGVTSRIPAPDQTPSELLEAADRAMYQAKRRGKNAVFSGTIGERRVL